MIPLSVNEIQNTNAIGLTIDRLMYARSTAVRKSTPDSMACIFCLHNVGPVDHISGPGGFYVCDRCSDHRATCSRGPRSGMPKASEGHLPHYCRPALHGEPRSYPRCVCGQWVINKDRHEATDLHRFLTPLAHAIPGRILISGHTADTLATALSGADGKIGRGIHPALGMWFPYPPGHLRDRATGTGVLAINASIWQTIVNTIEHTPIPSDFYDATGASAFVVAATLQVAYSKAPLAMWRILATPANPYAAQVWAANMKDLEKRLGSACIEWARGVWAAQLAAHVEGT